MLYIDYLDGIPGECVPALTDRHRAWFARLLEAILKAGARHALAADMFVGVGDFELRGVKHHGVCLAIGRSDMGCNVWLGQVDGQDAYCGDEELSCYGFPFLLNSVDTLLHPLLWHHVMDKMWHEYYQLMAVRRDIAIMVEMYIPRELARIVADYVAEDAMAQIDKETASRRRQHERLRRLCESQQAL
jgi:hypothetical protein